MRIGTRLLLANLAVLLAVSLAMAVAVPQVTRFVLVENVSRSLALQADRLARGAGGRLLYSPLAIRQYLYFTGTELALVTPDLRVALATDHPGLRELVDRPAPPPLAALLQEVFDEGVPARGLVAVPGGPDLVVGAAPVRSPRGTVVAAVLVAQPLSELEEGPLRVIVALLTLTGAAVAVVLSLLFSRTLVRRIGQLRVAAAALAEGRLDHRAPEAGTDELADLARSFNHMAARMEALVEGLRHSEQVRRDLMAAIAHELRTPITSIRGFAEALRDGVVPPDRVQRYYEIILSESTRLTRLIQDLFDLAKLDAGQMEFRLQPMDLAAWLESFVQEERDRLAQGGVPLVLVMPPGAAAPVLADPLRLEQVVHNLLDNAARYSPPGSPVAVRLTLHPGEVQVAVQDQGPGVPPDEAPHVWDRFYQGRDPGKRKGGAGLGLAIVRSIVAAHGGRVGLESPPEGGACFWFALPLAGEGATPVHPGDGQPAHPPEGDAPGPQPLPAPDPGC